MIVRELWRGGRVLDWVARGEGSILAAGKFLLIFLPGLVWKVLLVSDTGIQVWSQDYVCNC